MRNKNQWTIKNIETKKISSFKIGDEVSKKFHSRFANFIKNGLTVFVSVFIIYGVVQAGSLTPSSAPTPDGWTLENIYTRLTTNAISTSGNFSMDPSGSPAGTQYTLDQIYSAIPTIVADTVKLGTAYLGVDGTLVPSGGDAGTSNVCNGNTFFGSSQTDWNLQTGALNISPSAVISGNTYCGVAGTAVANPTYGDNSATQVLTTAGNAGTYDATNLSADNVRNAIAFGVGQTGSFSGNLAYGDDNASNVLTVASTPGTYNVSNLSNDVIKLGSTWGVSLGSTGTLTPDGGTSVVADLFNSKTAHLTSDWNLDTGTLDLACNTATFDGTGNIVTDTYDGAGNGADRWCMTDSGDAATSDILSGKIAWVDGVARTGAYDASGLAVGTVKSGTTFGVSSTGDYPSATYPLSGDTGSTDATAGEICNTNEAWTKAGGLITGTLNPTASTIGVGNTYCGVDGTLLKNLYNGSATSGDYPQSVGGVDDYNNNGTMPSDSYTSTWTTCDAGNNYCETNDATNANKKDDSTGLVWSIRIGTSNWFSANNCVYPNGLGDGVCDTNGEAACKCVKQSAGSMTGCETLGAAVAGNSGGWRLPHQKELMQAYINGSWGNLSSAGYNFWSATTLSNNTHNAWYTSLYYGSTTYTTKTSTTISVRCVR